MPRDRARLRILIVMEAAYPALRGGGAEAQVRTLSQGLLGRGHGVTVLVPKLGHGPQETIARVGHAVVCRLAAPGIPGLGGPILWVRTIAFLYARRDRYDVWHAHIAHRMAAICAVMGPWLGKRVLAKLSGWWELEKGAFSARAGVVNRLARAGLLRTGHWQAISHRIARMLIERGIAPRRVVYLPNAVDTQRFARVARNDDAPRFVFVGRLEKEKGLETLLAAFASIAPAYPDASLLLVGTGRLERTLKQDVSRLGLEGRVEFAGHRDDIETVYGQGNIGVMCSRIEGLSNALLESMASGLPMVASRISGNEDFVRIGETGWLFEPGDRAGLAKCLAEAVATPASVRSAMGEAARALVRQQAGIEQVLDRLLALYRDPAGQPPAPPPDKRSA